MSQATSENTSGKSQPWESFKFPLLESPERPAKHTVRSLSVPTQLEDMAAGAQCMPGILGSGPYDGSAEDRPSIIFSVLYIRKDTHSLFFCVCVWERDRKSLTYVLCCPTLDSLFWIMCLNLIFDWGCRSLIRIPTMALAGRPLMNFKMTTLCSEPTFKVSQLLSIFGSE